MIAPRRHPVTLAAFGYVLLTVAYTWPLPVHPLHGIAHDAGDPILNAWILWWSTRAVPLTAHWWNAPIFYPAAGTLAFSEHLLGLVPIAAPIIFLTGNPTLAYNVALFVSYVLCGLGAHFLAYTIVRRHDAAFVAGVAYAFAPYRLAQLPHLQVLSSYWAPICLAALHRYDEQIRRPVRRSFSEGGWAGLAAVAWLLQSLANGYYLFFFSVLLACWLLWFALGRWSIAAVGRVGGFFAAAALLLVPVLAGYRRILTGMYGFTRGLEVIQHFSADVLSLLHATDELLVWGWLHVVRRPEGELFPGVTIAALAVYAVVAARPWGHHDESTRTRWWLRRIFAVLLVLLVVASILPIVYGTWRLRIGGLRLVSIARADKPVTLALFAALAWMLTLPRVVDGFRRRSPLAFYSLAAFAMWVFSLGPDPTVFDHRALYQAPYGQLMRLPGFDGLRVPARFWMMAILCLTPLTAFAINRLNGTARRTVLALGVIGLLLDGWPKQFTVLAQPDRRPTPANVAARLDLPMTDDRDALALYQQTFDAVPLYNGFSGWAAPHQYAMRLLLETGDQRILQAMTRRGALGVVIDRESDAGGLMRKFVAAYPGAVLQDDRPNWSSYRLPAGESGDLLPDEQGDVIPIASLHALPSDPHTPRARDGDYRTRWSGGLQHSAADFTIEVEPGRVGQVVTDLGEFWADFPVDLRIDVSSDGAAWEPVFRGGTALHAYYAAVRHPKAVPLVFPIGRDHVRFIKLTQLGWGVHDWSIAEVRVRR